MTPMLAVRPDLDITGVDWRPCVRPGALVIRDVLTCDFPAASFDAVVGISSIEHIGLGHYDEDPLYPDGDVRCMARAATWLKPGGWVYADVPYGPAYRVHGTEYRVYDAAALRTRLVPPGLTVQRTWYAAGDGDHVLHDAPMPLSGMVYAAFVATKE